MARMMSTQVLGSLVFVVLLSILSLGGTESITVDSSSSSMCKTYFLSSGEEFNIYYHGATLDSECEFKLYSYGSDDLCVEAEKFDVDNGCQVSVKYFDDTSWTSSPEKSYSCYNKPSSYNNKWCPGKSNIKITIKAPTWGSSADVDIHLKISQTDSVFDDTIKDFATSVVTVTYIIVGCVIGGIILISVIVTVIICCVCNKRRNTRGTVFGNTQQAPNQVPIGAYPAATPAPYPQAGVYPQAGYPPAPQAGYQPGYQPPPQTTGYQTAPNMDYKNASAPPVEPIQPPPYPGN